MVQWEAGLPPQQVQSVLRKQVEVFPRPGGLGQSVSLICKQEHRSGVLSSVVIPHRGNPVS